MRSCAGARKGAYRNMFLAGWMSIKRGDVVWMADESHISLHTPSISIVSFSEELTLWSSGAVNTSSRC